jgi:Ser/Thr protein kinase RdoA (MazF antagonist)
MGSLTGRRVIEWRRDVGKRDHGDMGEAGQIAGLERQRLVRHGLAAAVALADRLGLPSSNPVVLSNRGNLLVRFPAAGLVARVATLTAWTRREPFRWLAREVAVARHVAGRDGPVVPPARGVDPGPHWQDGFAISLFVYLDQTTPAPAPLPGDCGIALARFHEAARDCPADLGYLSPATEQVTDALAVIEREDLADAATVAALRAAHERALGEIAAAGEEHVVLHGDAHVGNLLAAGNLLAVSTGGWVWTDLEETSRGPAAWDLATLASRYDAAGAREAVAAYAAEAGTPAPSLESLAPFRRARALEAAAWLLCMAHLYPERYAAAAQEQLTAVVSRR